MAQNFRASEQKSNEFQERNYTSPMQNLKNLNSSSSRQRLEQNKSGLNSDQSMTDNLGSDGTRNLSAHGPVKYRITTSTGSVRGSGNMSRNTENKGYVGAAAGEGKSYLLDPLMGQNIRGIAGSGDKTESKYMKIEKERLHEEGLQLKRQLHSLQDENVKLKTKNTHLEKEATKFEKMFQEAGTNPKKHSQNIRAEELTVPGLKQHIRDLKYDLDEKDSELNGLKKKAKVTKIHELEVQLQSVQDETLRLRAYVETIITKKTDKIIQEGDKHFVKVQTAETIRLKKELDSLQMINKTYELKSSDYQKQLENREEKYKRDQLFTNRLAQNKERELVKLRSQLVGYNAANAEAKKDSKPTENVSADTHIKKELEKLAVENKDLKTNLEEKDSRIRQLENQLKEIEAKRAANKNVGANKEFLIPKVDSHEPNASTSTRKESTRNVAAAEEEAKQVISNPSYPAQKPVTVADEPKKEPVKPVVTEPKEKKIPQQPKVSLDDAKKIGYHINLSFRVKGIPFEAIGKLDWKKQAASDGSISRDQIIKVLQNEIFGLSEKEIATLAQYLLQENNPKDDKTNDIEGVIATLTGLLGPLPYWDEDMKKKLHQSISKLCTEYRESLYEALSMTCSGKYLTKKDLEEAAKDIDIPLNFAQLEYIITKLYERSHDANKLSIDVLFELFCVEEEEKSEGDVKAGQKSSPRAKAKDSDQQENKQKGKAAQGVSQDKLANKEQEEKQAKELADAKKNVKEEKPAQKGGYRLSDDEENEGIYNDDDEDGDDYEGENNEHKLSDEEDGEKYEYLFPPEEEKNNEKITERGEDEEDDEEYRDDEDEYKEDSQGETKAKEVEKPKEVVTKAQKEPSEDEEYQDEEYEEEEDKEEKVKAKPEPEKKASVTSVPKSSQNELTKPGNVSEGGKSNRSDVNKQGVSPKQSARKEERKVSNGSEDNGSKKGKQAESKNRVETPEENYEEEEYEAEFPEEEI